MDMSMGSSRSNNKSNIGVCCILLVGLLLAASAEGRLAAVWPSTCDVWCWDVHPEMNHRLCVQNLCKLDHLTSDECGSHCLREEVDLPTALGEDCTAYCQRHARDFPGKYGACMIMCQSWHAGNASGDKILIRIKEDNEDEKKKQQDDVLVQLRTSCDECGNTSDFREYMGCLIENGCI